MAEPTLIEKYLKDLKRRGSSKNTLINREYILRDLTERLAKPLHQASADEILDVIESKHLAPRTEARYRNFLNTYFRWMDHEVRLPNLKVPNTLPVQPSDLVSPEDVKSMIQIADHPRDKALIAVTYESAARAREILGIRRKDITFEATHARIRVLGKTGERIIPIVESVPYLQQWLNYLGPLKPDEEIWKGPRGPIKHTAFWRILDKLSRQALGRHVNPHLLRHSRITHLVKHPEISNSVLIALAGWVQGTLMMKTYIHLAGADVEKAVLTMYGIAPKEATEPSPLQPIRCPRCEYENPADAVFCARCSLALDQAQALYVLDEDKLLLQALQDPRVRKAMAQTLRELLKE